MLAEQIHASIAYGFRFEAEQAGSNARDVLEPPAVEIKAINDPLNAFKQRLVECQFFVCFQKPPFLHA